MRTVTGCMLMFLVLALSSCGEVGVYPGGPDGVMPLDCPASVVRKAVGERLGIHGFRVQCPDPAYKSYSITQLLDFVSKDTTDSIERQSHYMDCDDFAYILTGRVKAELPGVAFGFFWCFYWTDTWLTAHAFCVFYEHETGKVYIIDPETDKIEEPQIILVLTVVM